MSANDLDSAADEQREEEKVKEVSQSHPQWESELECVVHDAKTGGGWILPGQNATFVIYRAYRFSWMDGICRGASWACLGRNI